MRASIPVVAIAAAVALLVPSAAFAEPPPLSASFTATDISATNHQWYATGTTNTSTTIATSGTVTFDYPTGTTRHNVNFTSTLKPSSCQSAGGVAGGQPVPNPAARAPWSASCRFDTPGTYTFACQIHPSMVGSIDVVGDSEPAVPSGTVPATLSLGIGTSASLGSFLLGFATDYLATVNAVVTSTAGDGTLTVHDPSATAPGHLLNGVYPMAQALQVKANDAATPTTAFAPVPAAASPLTLLTWAGPTSNDTILITFKQPVAATDPLRTGTYGKTLAFTLSTTNP